MATDRSDKVYGYYLEATQKFDYSVSGVALALVGYLGSTFRVAPIGWNPSTVELSALVCIFLSTMASLKRIEALNTLLIAMQKRLRSEESVGALTEVAREGGAAYNRATGEMFSPMEVLYKIQSYRTVVEASAEQFNKLASWAWRWYRLRDFCLVLGLALLVLSRILDSYGVQ